MMVDLKMEDAVHLPKWIVVNQIPTRLRSV